MTLDTHGKINEISFLELSMGRVAIDTISQFAHYCVHPVQIVTSINGCNFYPEHILHTHTQLDVE